jgi:hypothetical protein
MRRNLLVVVVCAIGSFGMTMLALSPGKVDATGGDERIHPLVIEANGLKLHASYGGVAADTGPGFRLQSGDAIQPIELVALNPGSSDVETAVQISVQYQSARDARSRLMRPSAPAPIEQITLKLQPGQTSATPIALPETATFEPGSQVRVSLVQGNTRLFLMTLGVAAQPIPVD